MNRLVDLRNLTNINISMLGIEGSGKSTYRAAILHYFFNGAVDNFYIRVKGQGKETYIQRQIVANRDLENSRELYVGRQFPVRTQSQANTFNKNNYSWAEYELYYRQSRLVNFQFVDYPGGVLKEITDGNNAKELDALAKQLITSEVLMVFIDASRLKLLGRDIASFELGIASIKTILGQTIETANSLNTKVNVIFVLSKIDANNISDEDIPKLRKDVEYMFGDFFAQTGTKFSDYKVFEVGVIGRANIRTQIFDDGMSIKNEIIGRKEFISKNVKAAFAEAFIETFKNYKYTRRELSNLYSELKLDLNWIQNFVDNLTGSKKRRDRFELESKYNDMKEKSEIYSKHIPFLRAIVEKGE